MRKIFLRSLRYRIATKSGIILTTSNDFKHNMKCFISVVNIYTSTSFYCDKWHNAFTEKAAGRLKNESY
jgi:hypothetical protein